MPLYRYECPECGARAEQYHEIDAGPDLTDCCRQVPRKLMPRRVRGRVVSPGQIEAEVRAERAAELSLRAGDAHLAKRQESALDIPAASWSGPPRDKADLEDRRRDTTEAMAAWQTRSLVADGVEYSTAKRRAEKHQQAVTAQAAATDKQR